MHIVFVCMIHLSYSSELFLVKEKSESIEWIIDDQAF